MFIPAHLTPENANFGLEDSWMLANSHTIALLSYLIVSVLVVYITVRTRRRKASLIKCLVYSAVIASAVSVFLGVVMATEAKHPFILFAGLRHTNSGFLLITETCLTISAVSILAYFWNSYTKLAKRLTLRLSVFLAKRKNKR